MIKMIRKANFLKNKIKLFMSGGYRIKLDKNNYILFKKEEDYKILFYLERVFFDLFKSILFNDEHKSIRVFFRMTLIENYYKNLPEIKIKIFYVKHKFKNPFKIKLPNLSCLDYFHYSEVFCESLENLGDLENKELEYKFFDLIDKIKDKINIKYYK